MDTSSRPAQPALQRFNRLFHDVYSARGRDVRQQLESGETPVIARIGDCLLLHSGEKAIEYEITGERYHELKAACHIPAAVQLALAGADSPGEEAAALLRRLDGLHGLGAGIDAIVSATRAFLERIPASGSEPDFRDAQAGYRGEARRVLEAIARDAARMEVEALDRAMRDIQGRLAPGRLRDSYFVVCGGHQPRYKQINKLYFRRWLLDAGWPEARIAHHLVYAEGKESLDEALELVRTRIVDGRLSAAVFGDLTSLDEDVLGDAGIEHLDRRFGG